ncbi:MAG: GH25 family lysozyme [Bilifractor sp.]
MFKFTRKKIIGMISAGVLVIGMLPVSAGAESAAGEETSGQISGTGYLEAVQNAETPDTAEEFGEAVQMILQASSEMNGSDVSLDEVEGLRSYISETMSSYEKLDEEEQEALADTRRSLENAEESAAFREDVLQAKEDGAGSSAAESENENSWRYVNGEPIASALQTAEEETETVSAMEDGDEGSAGGQMQYAVQSSVYGRANRSNGSSVLTSISKSVIGVDVSKWNGDNDWAKAKASGKAQFAIIRIGVTKNGSCYSDEYWEENVAGCIEQGIPFGFYYYSKAKSRSDVRKEAAKTLELLNEFKQKYPSYSVPVLPIYIDIEDSSQDVLSEGQLSGIAAYFCDLIKESNSSYKVGVYSGYYYYKNRISTFLSLSGYYHWIARYNTVLNYDGDYEIWQYGADSVDGIGTVTDVNYANSGIVSGENLVGDSNPGNVAYRLYNPNSGEHFYTSSVLERDGLMIEGWDYEGIAWKITSASAGIPLYRVYNPVAGDHHYTVSLSEKNNLVKAGWNDEGIAFYVKESSNTPVYREYNPNAKSGAHNFTTSLEEHQGLIKLGWRDENIGFYAAE